MSAMSSLFILLCLFIASGRCLEESDIFESKTHEVKRKTQNAQMDAPDERQVGSDHWRNRAPLITNENNQIIFTGSTDNVCCFGQVNSSRGVVVPRQCVLYSPDRDLCCKNTNGIIRNGRMRGLDCCHGLNPYNVRRDLCCDNGNVTINGVVDGLSCCGPSSHKVGVDLCCNRGSTLVIDGAANNLECCGPLVYTIGTDLCCSDEDKTRGTLTRNGLLAGMSCCAKLSYRPEFDLCCDDELIVGGRRSYPGRCPTFVPPATNNGQINGQAGVPIRIINKK